MHVSILSRLRSVFIAHPQYLIAPRDGERIIQLHVKGMPPLNIGGRFPLGETRSAIKGVKALLTTARAEAGKRGFSPIVGRPVRLELLIRSPYSEAFDQLTSYAHGVAVALQCRQPRAPRLQGFKDVGLLDTVDDVKQIVCSRRDGDATSYIVRLLPLGLHSQSRLAALSPLVSAASSVAPRPPRRQLLH